MAQQALMAANELSIDIAPVARKTLAPAGIAWAVDMWQECWQHEQPAKRFAIVDL